MPALYCIFLLGLLTWPGISFGMQRIFPIRESSFCLSLAKQWPMSHHAEHSFEMPLPETERAVLQPQGPHVTRHSLPTVVTLVCISSFTVGALLGLLRVQNPSAVHMQMTTTASTNSFKVVGHQRGHMKAVPTWGADTASRSESVVYSPVSENAHTAKTLPSVSGASYSSFKVFLHATYPLFFWTPDNTSIVAVGFANCTPNHWGWPQSVGHWGWSQLVGHWGWSKSEDLTFG